MYPLSMHTSMRVSPTSRDRLAAIAHDELGGVTLDTALSIILFERDSAQSVARLIADPDALADYQREAIELADATSNDGLDDSARAW